VTTGPLKILTQNFPSHDYPHGWSKIWTGNISTTDHCRHSGRLNTFFAGAHALPQVSTKASRLTTQPLCWTRAHIKTQAQITTPPSFKACTLLWWIGFCLQGPHNSGPETCSTTAPTQIAFAVKTKTIVSSDWCVCKKTRHQSLLQTVNTAIRNTSCVICAKDTTTSFHFPTQFESQHFRQLLPVLRLYMNRRVGPFPTHFVKLLFHFLIFLCLLLNNSNN